MQRRFLVSLGKRLQLRPRPFDQSLRFTVLKVVHTSGRNLSLPLDGGCQIAPASEVDLQTEVRMSAAEKDKRVAEKRAVPEGFSVIQEGEAEILQHGNDVFYNKTQVVNRDLSIALIRTFIEKKREEAAAAKANKRGKKFTDGNSQSASSSNQASNSAIPEVASAAPQGTTSQEEGPTKESTSGAANPQKGLGGPGSSVRPITILEGLAASGLRSIRYAKEIEGVGTVVANDNDKVAAEACRRNVAFNGSAATKIKVEEADARVLMLTREKQFDVVDLDPYGSPSIFLDSAVQAVSDGGLFLCTATDMAVLCGNSGEVCYSKYGAYPVRGKHCHEMALRILLAAIESAANRYKRHIVPVLSVSVDFYIRVFVRIYTSASAMKATPTKLSYIYQCTGCDSYHLQPVGRMLSKNNNVRYTPGIGPSVNKTCDDCGRNYHVGGPIWSEPIYNPDWVSTTLKMVKASKARYPAYDKIHSILTAVSEELVDCPLYVGMHSMSGTIKCTPPSAVLFRSAVANAGYSVSSSHANPLALKTDAPMTVLWDIMRCWVKDHPVKKQKEETPGTAILAKAPVLQANFARANSAVSRAQASGVPRFLPNPEQYWGPKPRAGRTVQPKHTPLLGPAAANGLGMKPEAEKAQEEEPPAKRAKVEESEEKGTEPEGNT